MRLTLVPPLLLTIAWILPAQAAPVPPGRTALPFIENDYARALAEARTRKLPLFIEAWAPW